MSLSQPGIFDKSSTSFYYLEYKIDYSVDKSVYLAKLKELYSKDLNQAHVNLNFGKKAWDYLNPSWSPKGLVSFEALKGKKGYEISSTQQDLMFWIHGTIESKVLDLAMRINNTLKEVLELVYEEKGFQYHSSRDLTGFEDGTGNPKTEEKKTAAAFIPAGELGEGGSYVCTQRWEHNIDKFNNHPVKEQEQIIGRTKADSVELTGDEMPKNSHVSRTDIDIDGVAMKMWRRSSPFGGVDTHGLNFHCFACEILRISSQLESMLGLTEDGITDRILEFSTPKRSAYWFCPSQEDLKKLLD